MIDIHDVLMLFYIATPIFPWAICTIVFSLIEYARLDSNEHGVSWQLRIPNIVCGFALCCISILFFPLIGIIKKYVTDITGYGFIDLTALPLPPTVSLIITVLVIIFVKDLFFALWHRALHTFDVLWDIHAVHHSECHMTSTSYMRQNWIDGTLQSLFITIPTIILINADPIAFYYAFLISVTWNFFAHADLPLHLGFLTPVITGPQLHRLHHSVYRHHQNSNYAQFFPIWDILLGSYVSPQKNEFPPTGLGTGDYVETARDMTLWPFMRWLQRMRT